MFYNIKGFNGDIQYVLACVWENFCYLFHGCLLIFLGSHLILLTQLFKNKYLYDKDNLCYLEKS